MKVLTIMHLVQQLTPFTCGLACIESVSFDLGRPITQAQLMIRYKDTLIGGTGKPEHFGAANGEQIAYFLHDLGFRTSILQDFRHEFVRKTLNGLSDTQAALISAHFDHSAWHFVRWAGFQDDDTMIVMNPDFSLPRASVMPFPLAQLVEWEFTMLLISSQ